MAYNHDDKNVEEEGDDNDDDDDSSDDDDDVDDDDDDAVCTPSPLQQLQASWRDSPQFLFLERGGGFPVPDRQHHDQQHHDQQHHDEQHHDHNDKSIITMTINHLQRRRLHKH